MTMVLIPWILAAGAGIVGPFLDDASREARAGVAAYEKEEWVEAVTRLLRARAAAPTDAVIDYDLGAAAFRSGDLQTAARSFAAAAGNEAVPPGAAEYNLGNTLVEAEQLEPALEAYRAALRADPGDEDARHNYEVTLARLERQDEDPEPPQPDQPQQNPENQEPGDQEQEQEQEPRDGDSREQPEPEGQEDRDETEPPDGGNEQEPEPGSEGEEPPPPGEARPREEEALDQLTREQALRLLDAVIPEEKELLRARLEPSRKRRAEKDW